MHNYSPEVLLHRLYQVKNTSVDAFESHFLLNATTELSLTDVGHRGLLHASNLSGFTSFITSSGEVVHKTVIIAKQCIKSRGDITYTFECIIIW